MKKVLSVLCMALLAGGMIFTSCTKNFTITVNTNNDAWGTVTGAGTYADGATATLTATPNEGYQFVKWQDGNTDNPRTITVTADATYTAEFAAVPVVPSVKVAFNGENWTAGVISGYFSSNYNAWQVAAFQQADQYPYSDVCMYTGTATGSHTDNAGDNGFLSTNGSEFGWVEYYLSSYLYDQQNNKYGDWWAKNATVAVTAFDATALNMTANVNATMFDANEALVDGAGVAAAATAPMTIQMNNVSLSEAKSVNGKMAKKAQIVGKLVASK